MRQRSRLNRSVPSPSSTPRASFKQEEGAYLQETFEFAPEAAQMIEKFRDGRYIVKYESHPETHRYSGDQLTIAGTIIKAAAELGLRRGSRGSETSTTATL